MSSTDELLIAYGLAKQGENDPKPFNYGNMMVSFMSGLVYIFNVAGDTNYGGYKIPPTEEKFLQFLDERNKKIEELEDNLMYICFKCRKEKDLPEFQKDYNGNKVCRTCATGDEIPDELPETESFKKAKEEGKASKEMTAEELKNVKSAMKYLEKRGYVVKKLLASYRVAYLDVSGNAQISKEYFKNEDEFTKTMRDCTFLNMITKLKREEEILEL